MNTLCRIAIAFSSLASISAALGETSKASSVVFTRVYLNNLFFRRCSMHSRLLDSVATARVDGSPLPRVVAYWTHGSYIPPSF